jgi:hypothetical protein
MPFSVPQLLITQLPVTFCLPSQPVTAAKLLFTRPFFLFHWSPVTDHWSLLPTAAQRLARPDPSSLLLSKIPGL